MAAQFVPVLYLTMSARNNWKKWSKKYFSKALARFKILIDQFSAERYFLMMSMGMGNITVEFFSALIPLRVCDNIGVISVIRCNDKCFPHLEISELEGPGAL